MERQRQHKRDGGGNQAFLDRLSTHFLVCKDKRPGKGEDSGLEIYTESGGLLGVFDGCGGLGAMQYATANDMTGAYLASRTACNAARLWFQRGAQEDGQWDVEALRAELDKGLDICQSAVGEPKLQIKGSMVRPLPTTLAMIVCSCQGGALLTQHIWAGDSRTYVLEPEGLAQISVDDLDGSPDALRNLSNDGAMTNVVTVDKKYTLHQAELRLDRPCILFSATDGCFGYLPTPMHFEELLLRTLESAENVVQWRERLTSCLGECAGDDMTISLAAFGYDTFRALQEAFYARWQGMNRVVVALNEALQNRDEGWVQKTWQSYSADYYRFTRKRA